MGKQSHLIMNDNEKVEISPTMPHALQFLFRRSLLNSAAHNMHMVVLDWWTGTGADLPNKGASWR